MKILKILRKNYNKKLEFFIILNNYLLISILSYSKNKIFLSIIKSN